VLAANPEIYAKTVFFLNYDEQGGFFDHVPPPTPPTPLTGGKSTVTTVGEVFESNPIGLGFRVPMIIISPWTRGGFVNSEVFDHTSVIKFVEKKFNVTCPNISPWRRAVVGDLMSVFDFEHPNFSWPKLPDTSDYVEKAKRECDTLPPPKVPSKFIFPTQEPGTKPSRAIPYEFHVTTRLDISKKALLMSFVNTGNATMVVQVYDRRTPTNSPRSYTVEPKKALSDNFPVSGIYAYAVHGPNGYYRQFVGDSSLVTSKTANPDISLSYDITKASASSNAALLNITFSNTGSSPCIFLVKANAYFDGQGPWQFPVDGSSSKSYSWNLGANGNWYDFSVTLTKFDASWTRKVMGRVETGFPSITDPAMGK
jgi:phospholipase C